MERDAIERIRAFNRAFTRRIGVLDGSYLGRGRPLGQARLLFEIGPDGSDLKSLRDRLGLDSGYLSRLMRSLEAQGLARVKTDSEDGRRRRAVPTEAGREEWTAYDRLSDDFARSILEPLSMEQRDRLVAAMGEVEALMMAASVRIAAEPHYSAFAQL
jgi:DNA-binding MarR family transcriptional regulator